jgi:serine protease Do
LIAGTPYTSAKALAIVAPVVMLVVMRGLLAADPIEGGEEAEPGGEVSEQKLGIVVDDLSAQALQQLGLPRDTTGVVVTDISRVSEAYEKNIDQGDVISEVNRVPVKNVSEFRREVRKVKEGGLVVFYVTSPARRGGDPQSRYVTVRLREGK